MLNIITDKLYFEVVICYTTIKEECRMNDNASIVMSQIMFELTNWLNNTSQPYFEIREKDYFRWLENSRRLSTFSDPDVKKFKQAFDKLIYMMRQKKTLFFGTLYTTSTENVRKVFEELHYIEMRYFEEV